MDQPPPLALVDPLASAHPAVAPAPARALRVPSRSGSIWRDLLFLMAKIATIVLAFGLAFTFVFGVIRYQEPGMAPAVKDGDLVLFFRFASSSLRAQDAVLITYQGQWQVRRVIAVAGDVVDITDAGLMINGSVQQEPEIYQATDRFADGVTLPLTVPPGEVFLLGDARNKATDSRIYGCVRTEDIRGKVMMVIRHRSI
jgi:signal peptidase I